ncbi:hypothetical protein [Caulobacter vibrioides]|uniref:Uncharacterized protein n=1 Tax=Caulobacter vibrioides (strain NA1000 / CB15N) TaxID=565050 RepID=A0A0H3J1I0_CAUVN|nr:hypothetical protein [Caulobacter vibrioides]YP_009020499.1 hypothetical protein CCNA_03927 [Caulobacter vibrioides NA1000]AHI88530.1 hypothetical protein CCNA_03927 [Caulobacter vibrioides NA1000]AVH77059.1 hypothetical protein CA607_20255 [Caulobacter vibrioides]QXZ52757.1 hypothetical protein KZH45_03505 [Caulobacter vibrioides]
MILFFLPIVGALIDGLMTFWALGRFGDSIESNPVILALKKRIGRSAAFLPVFVSAPAALIGKYYIGDDFLIALAAICWLPVFWNIATLIIMFRKSRET